jgi:copper transport protein
MGLAGLTMTKVFGFACLLLAFLLLRDAPAHAHASLVSSTPADAAVVGSVPRSVVLQFDEPVAVTSVRITTSDATQHVLTSEARNQQVIVSVPQDLPAGSHVISYRVISADGHPVFGSIVFSIGKPTRTPDAGSSSASWIIGGAIWLARWALYVGLLGSTGGAFFVTWISIHHTPARVVSGIRAAAIVGVVAMALSLGLLGLDMLGDGFGAMLVSRTWIEAARTSSGLAVLVGAAACVIAFASLAPKTNSYSRVMSAIALAGAGLALSLTGHASTAEPQWLMRPALFIHAAAAAYWVGSLVPLAAVIRAAPAQSIPTVRRFSGGAIIAVTALVVAGVAVSVVQIGSWSALIETPYGRLWVIKIFGVSLMLGLAAVNRSVLTPALSTGADVARRLVPSIAVEAAVALSVLGIVAGWRFTPPPRASVPPPAPAVHVHLHGLSAIAEVDIRPGRVGQVDVAATLLSGDFQPLEAKELVLLFRHSGAGIEAIQRSATRTSSGQWTVGALVLPIAGQWTIRAEVLISDFEKQLLEADCQLPR